MGISTTAMLVYGYHLGSDDSGWNLEGVGEYDDLPALDWYDPDDDSEGFQEAAENKLLASIGFTETDWRADGYFDRKRAASARLGVGIDTHGSGDYPMYLLIAKGITAYQGDAEPVTLAALTAELEEKGADAALSAALTVLGLTPKQEQASWLLCSYRG